MTAANTNTTATIYLIPLAGGAVTNVGTITGLTNATTLNSTMFSAAGTLYFAGSGSGGGRLWTAPLTGGAATNIGLMGEIPQDFGSAPSPSPAITKAFSPTVVAVNSNSTLTITLSNSYANPQRGAAFTDTYPAGLVNAPVPGASTTCGDSVTAAAGGGSVALSGGTIPASGSCTVTVNVRSAALGTYNNSIPAGGLTTILAFSDSAERSAGWGWQRACGIARQGASGSSISSIRQGSHPITQIINGSTSCIRLPARSSSSRRA